MEVAFIITGILAIWAFLASKSNNPYLRTLLYFETFLLAYSAGLICYFDVVQGTTTAMKMWVTALSLLTFGYLGTWAGFWIVGSAEKEGFDDDLES